MVDFNDQMGSFGLGNLQNNAVNAQLGGNLGSQTGGIAGNAVGADAAGGILGGAFGKNGVGTFALGGLQTLGSIWNSFQQMKLAKDTLKFQKNAFKTNLKNSTQVYNTALEDRIRARYHTEGRSDQADAKIEENRL